MSVSILDGSLGGSPRACLVNDASDRPLPLPCFESREHAVEFLLFCRHRGERDVAVTPAERLETLHTIWHHCIKGCTENMLTERGRANVIAAIEGAGMRAEPDQ
jgi:hypothetical protein